MNPNKGATILDCVPTVTVAMHRSAISFSVQFCVQEKFKTSPVAERAVIGGFTHRNFYAQR